MQHTDQTPATGTFLYKEVYVIEDIEFDCFIAENMLKRCSFAETIHFFSSPSDALLDLYNRKSQEPTVVFLDIHMGTESGFDFLDNFAALPEDVKSLISLVVLSASLRNEYKLRALRNPYVEKWIDKPINCAKLMALQHTRSVA